MTMRRRRSRGLVTNYRCSDCRYYDDGNCLHPSYSGMDEEPSLLKVIPDEPACALMKLRLETPINFAAS